MEKNNKRNERLAEMYKSGKSTAEMAAIEGLSTQRVCKILKDYYPEYKQRGKTIHIAKHIIPCDEPMTDEQLVEYNKVKSMYNAHAADPSILYRILAERFGTSGKLLSVKIRRFKDHLESGKPYFKKRKKSARPKGLEYKPRNPPVPSPKPVRVKRPDDIWEAASRKGLIPPRVA